MRAKATSPSSWDRFGSAYAESRKFYETEIGEIFDTTQIVRKNDEQGEIDTSLRNLEMRRSVGAMRLS